MFEDIDAVGGVDESSGGNLDTPALEKIVKSLTLVSSWLRFCVGFPKYAEEKLRSPIQTEPMNLNLEEKFSDQERVNEELRLEIEALKELLSNLPRE